MRLICWRGLIRKVGHLMSSSSVRFTVVTVVSIKAYLKKVEFTKVLLALSMSLYTMYWGVLITLFSDIIMCRTYTKHYACGCDEAVKARSNGCDGNCTGNNIIYDDSMDETSTEKCVNHVLQSPPTSSDSSETSDE